MRRATRSRSSVGWDSTESEAYPFFCRENSPLVLPKYGRGARSRGKAILPIRPEVAAIGCNVGTANLRPDLHHRIAEGGEAESRIGVRLRPLGGQSHLARIEGRISNWLQNTIKCPADSSPACKSSTGTRDASEGPRARYQCSAPAVAADEMDRSATESMMRKPSNRFAWSGR